MPPRKAKQATPSSQPAPERTTRTAGRKRRASDASSVVSERPQSSQGSTAAAPSKKRKRGRPARSSIEPEAIAEETEQQQELDAHHQAMQLGGDATYEHDPAAQADTIDVLHPKSKHVQFRTSISGGGNRTTATTTTPHPRKTVSAYKRRVTSSPAVKRQRTSNGRVSLPADASQEEDGATPGSATAAKIIREYQFSPLRTVLDERIRRRLRRSHLSEEQNAIDEHEKRDSRTAQELEALRGEAAEKERHIAQLEEELEFQRQAAIDITDDDATEQKVTELEEKLAAMREQLAEHMATHRLEQDIDMHEPDMDIAVFDSQEDVGHIQYPNLPTPGPSQELVLSRSVRSPLDANAEVELPEIRESTGRVSMTLVAEQEKWDKERQRYRDAIEVFSKEAGEAKGKLQSLEIELSALGFGGTEVDSLVILDSIRQSFIDIRNGIEDTLPESLPDGASTQDVVEILIANTKELTQRLREFEIESRNKDLLTADLKRQVEKLLDHLATAEIRKTELEGRFDELDHENDGNLRSIEELQEDLRAITAMRDSLQVELHEKKLEYDNSTQDLSDAIKNVEKLTISLEQYRAEEEKLQNLIVRMEEDHREAIRKMNVEREATIQEMDEKLDIETQMRSEGERLADERETEITQLQIKVEELGTERDELKAELEETILDRDAEKEGREVAEAGLGEKNVEVEDLESRVDRLEEELDILNKQLTELRTLNDAERHQRENAEADLDDRNVEVDGLNKRLKGMGTEANTLRMQIFGLTEDHKKKVAELEKAASDRDAQYQTDMEVEVQRREDAEDLAQQRAITILDLQRQLEELELRMRNTIAERDEEIEQLKDDVATRDTEIEGLKMDLRSAENDRDNQREVDEEKIEELQGSIAALQETISAHEATIQQLQMEAINTTELHNSEIEDRNTQIADLHEQVHQLRVEIEELQQRNAGLERRVEQEAEAMLELQNAKEDEIDDLKAQLQAKQASILKVEDKAKEADLQWQELLSSRDDEIAELRASAGQQEEVIETTVTELAAHKERFRAYVDRTNQVLVNLRAQLKAAQAVASEEGAELVLEGEAALNELKRMDVVGELKRTVTTTKKEASFASSSQGAVVKKGKGGRKSKRGMDSGIGMDGEAESPQAA